MKYLSIQRFRCAAALFVLIYHLGKHAHNMLHLDSPLIDVLRHPVLGSPVYLFFVISGFVLSHSLRTTPVRDFLVFRLLRLYPSYLVAVGLVLACQICVMGPPPLSRRAILAGLSLLPVGPRSAYFLGVEWTLVYEVFFSLVIALFAIGGRWSVLGGTLAWLALLFGKCWFWPEYASVYRPNWAEIGLSAKSMPFLFGVLVEFVRLPALRCRKTVAALLLPLVPCLVAIATGVDNAELQVILVGLGYAALVWAFTGDSAQQSDDLAVRYGDWSYGTYLIHSAVITICFAIATRGAQVSQPYSLVASVGALAVLAGAWFGQADVWLYGRLRRRYQGRTTAPAILNLPMPERQAA